jgi:GMP synthase (glutamine-hydrolysing)
LQFHPELDASGIAIRIDAYKHHGYLKPEEAESLKERCSRETVTVPMEILRRFVALARNNFS